MDGGASATAPKTGRVCWFVLSRPLAFQDASSRAEQVKFEAGHIISRQGEPSDKIYIITKV